MAPQYIIIFVEFSAGEKVVSIVISSGADRPAGAISLRR